jgi:hypothetical protein
MEGSKSNLDVDEGLCDLKSKATSVELGDNFAII